MNSLVTTEIDSNVIQLENECSKIELQWLFENEYFDVIKDLKDTVTNALKFMETSNEHKEKKSDDIRLVIESPKVLEGYVKFEDHTITDSKIIIKHSKINKGASFRTSIGKNKPWKLYQLKNTYNHFKQAHKLINNELDKNISEETVKLFLFKIIGIGTKIKELFLLNAGDIPKTNQHEFVFNPPLPPNLNIQFEYSGKSFLTNVFILNKKKTISESDIENLIQIHVPSKKVETIFEYVERMCKIANEFQDKIRPFLYH